MLSSGIPLTQLHISVSEKLVYCFLLLSTLLAGLLLQHMLHASVCFTSCKCSNPSVLVAEKSHSQTKILMNTGTHLEKKQSKKKKKQLLKSTGTCSTAFTVTLHKARNIHYSCFSWNSQLTFIGSVSNVSVNHTYQEPPPQV